MNLTLEASFEGLERGLERILEWASERAKSPKAKSIREKSLKSDDAYELLWELGSNVLKYGIHPTTSTKIRINSHKKYDKSLKQSLASHKIYAQAFVCERFIQISLRYLVGKNITNLKSSQNATLSSLAPLQILQVPQVYALRYDELKSSKNLSTKNLPNNNPKNLSAKSNDFDCSSHLGNKVIAYLVDKICYDSPKIFLPNARERTLRVRLKP